MHRARAARPHPKRRKGPGVEAERHALDTTGGQHGRLVEALELLITSAVRGSDVELRDLGARDSTNIAHVESNSRERHGQVAIDKGRVGQPVAEGVGRFYVMGVVAPVPDLQLFIIINFETGIGAAFRRFRIR